MEENVNCCFGCDGRGPEKQIIQGVFEIHHTPWLFLSATGNSVAIRLYSSHQVNPRTGKGVESEKAYLKDGKLECREKLPVIKAKIKAETAIMKFKLNFEVVKDFGIPGAFVIESRCKKEFFLKTATLSYGASGNGDGNSRKPEVFYCNSWVYPLHNTNVKRIFFSNHLCLPMNTPPGLVKLRQKELEKLRGGGSKDERKPWDRIYEYDNYNDLGDPDNGPQYARPVLGGSSKYPYPRRLRTGRPPPYQDQFSESRPAGCFQIYVPRDERLSNDKQQELKKNFVDALVRFLTPKPDHPLNSYPECPEFIKKIAHFFVPREALSTSDFKMILSIINFFTKKPNSSSSSSSTSREKTDIVNSVEDIDDIFADKEVKELDGWIMQQLEKLVPNEIYSQIIATITASKGSVLYSQLPSIIAEEKDAFTEDMEFGRQLLAGTNPVRIRLLKEFSPTLSETAWKCNPELLEEVKKAIVKKEAFILDHHDYLLPYLNMINGKGACALATRTILISQSNMLNTITPVAIELSSPDPKSNDSSFVFTNDQFFPRWELAKLHVSANDAAYHQLVSHWLHTHAVMEPFIIATRRQLSVKHPIHRLLDPHFKDTLHINALARAIFLNAGGIVERTLFTGEYSMQLSSHLYKQWRFDEQALPTDLVNRGMAVKAAETLRAEHISAIKEMSAECHEGLTEIKEEQLEMEPEEIDDEEAVERDEDTITDKTSDEKVTYPGGVKLILEDYPYAKDGIEIWDAIEKWVEGYCEVFYLTDADVEDDVEIREWWSEIRSKGHGDQPEGWYELTTKENLVKALTTLIWIASGLHSAVNSGQYAYAGWPPNRPMLLRKFVPGPDSPEMKEAGQDPDKFVCQMLPGKFQMAFVIAVMDLLSRHTSEEVYLGQMPPENKWEDEKIHVKFKELRDKLKEIEENIKERNRKYNLMNRWGYAKIPYKLLYPATSKTKAQSMEKGGMGIAAMGIINSISL